MSKWLFKSPRTVRFGCLFMIVMMKSAKFSGNEDLCSLGGLYSRRKERELLGSGLHLRSRCSNPGCFLVFSSDMVKCDLVMMAMPPACDDRFTVVIL